MMWLLVFTWVMEHKPYYTVMSTYDTRSSCEEAIKDLPRLPRDANWGRGKHYSCVPAPTQKG